MDNQGAGTLAGNFAGLLDGDVVGSYNGWKWAITYDADATLGLLDNGNDIALYAVPEPASAAVLGLMAAVLLRRRR